jgi:uncharacterized protein YndB with AHSA1/START domain
MSDQPSVKFTRTIHTTPAQVYRAFTNASALREWLADGATTDIKAGGRIILWWSDGYSSTGQFTGLEEDKKVGFTWKGDNEPARTQVEVNISTEGEGSNVEIIHSGLGEGEPWEATRHMFQRSWEAGLENLVSILETGKDLRIYRRPMLGIMLTDFNAEVAGRLGIPVKEGIRIDGTLEGMGARAAGLEGDDVLVGMAGRPVTDFDSLRAALEGKHAGDVVEVEYYRGPEKKTVPMKLSGRPEPQIPGSIKEIAARAQEVYAEMDRELDAALAGVSEAEASAKPQAGEWSVKEILCHLISSERFNIQYLTELFAGNESWNDNYPGNLQHPIDATLEVFPTLSALIEELRRGEAETIALIRHLPEEFTQRKGSYWRLVEAIQNFPYHIRTHTAQIQAAVDAARQG